MSAAGDVVAPPAQHGERGYNRGCRCTTCREGTRVAQARRRRQRAYGRQLLVDAAPVREHVAKLRAAGLGVHRIAELAGTSHQAVTKLVYGQPARGQGPSRRMRPESAAAILAVRATSASVAASQLVDGTGTRRRLQALVHLGWSYKRLAAQLGVKPDTVGSVLAAERTTASMARQVSALYDRLWNSTPPLATRWDRSAASTSRTRAAAAGWAPPLAWDDDTIDDPAATPQHAAPGPNGAPGGRRIHFEDVEFLLLNNYSVAGIAARLGATDTTMERYVGVIRAAHARGETAADVAASWRSEASTRRAS